MSTGVDARRRPSLWSYISFNPSPRKRSVSLPKPNNNHGRGPYDKVNRYRSSGWSTAQSDTVENIKESWMTGGQRSRLLKTGGVIAFVVFLLYLFTPSNTADGVKDLVKGPPLCFPLRAGANERHQAMPHPAFLKLRIRPWGRRNARNPLLRTSL